MALSRPAKLGLLAAAAATLVVVLALNIGESRTIVVSTQPNSAAPISASAVLGVLQNPRYTGATADGTAWELAATAATQQATQQGAQVASGTVSSLISLSTVTAEWRPATGQPLALKATEAVYNPTLTELKLANGLSAEGAVRGYTVRLQARHAAANLNAGTLHLAGGVSARLEPR